MRRVLFTFEDVEWLLAQTRNCDALADCVLGLIDARESTPIGDGNADVASLRARVRELENALKHSEAKRAQLMQRR